MEKSLVASKTFWAQIVGLVATLSAPYMPALSEALTPEVQQKIVIGLWALSNVFLRVVTSARISTVMKGGGGTGMVLVLLVSGLALGACTTEQRQAATSPENAAIMASAGVALVKYLNEEHDLDPVKFTPEQKELARIACVRIGDYVQMKLAEDEPMGSEVDLTPAIMAFCDVVAYAAGDANEMDQ